MKVFEIINPSDQCTIRGEFKDVVVATLLIGGGRYGLREIDGDLKMPVFLMGGLDEWLLEKFAVPEPELSKWLAREAENETVTEALESVLLGGVRERELLELLDPKDRMQQLDKMRTSMNNICGRAHKLAYGARIARGLRERAEAAKEGHDGTP